MQTRRSTSSTSAPTATHMRRLGIVKTVRSTNHKGVQWTHVTMNAEKGALKEQEVRDAVGHAINREAIAQAAIGPVEAR